MPKLIKDTSIFTNSFTYNFQPSAPAAFSGARLIKGFAYSRKKQKEKQKEN